MKKTPLTARLLILIHRLIGGAQRQFYVDLPGVGFNHPKTGAGVVNPVFAKEIDPRQRLT